MAEQMMGSLMLAHFNNEKHSNDEGFKAILEMATRMKFAIPLVEYGLAKRCLEIFRVVFDKYSAFSFQ